MKHTSVKNYKWEERANKYNTHFLWSDFVSTSFQSFYLLVDPTYPNAKLVLCGAILHNICDRSR